MALTAARTANYAEDPDRPFLGILLQTANFDEDGEINSDNECCSLNNANLLKEEQFCWRWDPLSMSTSISLDHENKEVLFHPDYSCGTAAIRGTEPFEFGYQHYWEVKMTSAVYGTDMMIGIGSNSINLNNSRTVFSSLLGKDSESYGLSYLGTIQHKGEVKQFTKKLERDAVVGIHLDMWHGTLSVFCNGKPCGVAFQGLQNKELYPMLSSTAARTRMKLERSCSVPTSLQYLCCETIGKNIARVESVDDLPLPPGTKKFIKNHMGWVIETASSRHVKINQTSDSDCIE